MLSQNRNPEIALKFWDSIDQLEWQKIKILKYLDQKFIIWSCPFSRPSNGQKLTRQQKFSIILTQCSILINKDCFKKFMNCNTVFKFPFPDWSECYISIRTNYILPLLILESQSWTYEAHTDTKWSHTQHSKNYRIR